jgi:prepilin-type N-terminal cleavage/methylation domain-containing protein
MRRSVSHRAFTLIELMLTMVVVGMLGVALLMFSSTSSRFIARNLATNHSHEATRISSQRLLKELRDSATSFRLFDFDGTNFNDATVTPSADNDVLSGQFASNRTNGVRFRQLIAGPCVLAGDTTPTSTSLTFSIPSGSATPQAGDKLVLPLISQEYDISAVSGASTALVVTINPAVGYTLNTTSPNVITGYFYRRVAFSVFKNELRYHPNFTGASRSTYKVVRDGVTSPKPFALLFPTLTSSTTDALSLRVSLEITDLGYSSRRFGNGTTTLYSVIPPRNQPTAVSFTN